MPPGVANPSTGVCGCLRCPRHHLSFSVALGIMSRNYPLLPLLGRDRAWSGAIRQAWWRLGAGRGKPPEPALHGVSKKSRNKSRSDRRRLGKVFQSKVKC